jgi:protoporphyrinogen IX oxidase
VSVHAALKALHIASLVLWCGALLALPTLFRHRGAVGEQPKAHELHRVVRAIFVGLASPAAFVAVGSGTALIFVGAVFTPWMFLKLAVVAALVGMHVRAGFVLFHLFDPGRRYPRWRQVGATTTISGVLAAILVLVLAKPRLGTDFLPRWMTEPGGLQSFSSTIMPMP